MSKKLAFGLAVLLSLGFTSMAAAQPQQGQMNQSMMQEHMQQMQQMQ